MTTQQQKLLLLQTNSTEQSPCLETNNFSASQEIPRILWKSRVHYSIHNSPIPVPVLSQIQFPPHPILEAAF